MKSQNNNIDRPNTLVMVAATMLTSLVAVVFARVAYGLILPTMRVSLDLSYSAAGNLSTATALGYLLFVLLGGLAAARWGSRWTVLQGLLLITLGFGGLTVADSYPLLVVLMFLLGIGTAFCVAPMLSLLATWYPHRRGLMIGCWGAGIGAGRFVAGLLVPWLIQLFGEQGWRVTWAVFGGVSVAAILLVWVGVKDPPPSRDADNRGPKATDKWQVYRDRRVLTVGGLYGSIGIVYIIQIIFMVGFAEASGISRTTAGWLFSLSGALSAICGPLWGALSDHWGRGNTLLLALLVISTAMVLPLWSQTLPVFFCHFLLIGLSMGGVFTLIQATSAEQVEAHHIPIVLSYVTVFFASGQFVGPAIASWLIDAAGFRVAVGFACAVLLIALYLVWQIRRFPTQNALH